jgi:tetratricopeptide (TPR) repeat protein
LAEEPKPNFGKYQVQGVLGEGGMGRVWRAYDPDLEVTVAIKELKEQFRDQANLERFFREAQIAAKCRHQNIVLITDLSKSPPYFVMEFLEARELSTYVHKGVPITLTQLVRILSQVCDGLGFLHSRGIFHRDLKPANIMLLKDDVVKVTDFGISKAPFGQATMTQVIMGTIPYMSPEQITTPGKVDGRSDLWALGVITYELTQRRHPFPGEGDINTIFHIVHSPPAAFGAMPPKVEGPVQQLLTKALQKSPDDRIRSTEEFKVMLQGLLRGVPDPDSVVFPYQEVAATSTSTSIITEEELLKAIAKRAFVLVEEIESLGPERKAVLTKRVLDNAAEVARMARVLVAERNLLGLEAVLKDLETQKGLLEAGVREGIGRLRGEAEAHAKALRHPQAAEAWSKILALEPNDSAAKQGLEQVRKGLALAQREAESLRAVVGHVARGREIEGRGNYPDAIAEYKKALSLQPGNPDATRALHDAQKRLEARNEAAAHLDHAREALKQHKPQEILFYAQKVLAIDAGNEEAKRLVAEAASIQGTIELAAQMRTEGRQFLAGGDLESARRSWGTVLEVEPGDREATEALRKIEQIAREQQGRQAGLQKAGEAEVAMKAQEYEKAIGIYKDAERLAPGDPAVQRGAEAARKAIEDLRSAEKGAAEREKSGDLAGAIQAWEKVLTLQRAHPSASKEVERIRGLVRKEEERRRSEADRRRAEEEARRLVASRQQEIGTALEALGEEMGAAREALDERFLGAIRDLVGRSRKATSATELRALEGALAEIGAARKGLREAVQRSADAAFESVAAPAAIIRETPEEDFEAIGSGLMSKAKEALSRLDAAHGAGDLKGIRDQARAVQSASQEVAQKRDAAVAKGAAAIREATAALEGALKPSEKNLKEATVRHAREAIARAARDATGPRLKPMSADVEALRAARESLLKEIQDNLRSLREKVHSGRAALEAAVSKNRRAVLKSADLSKRVDALIRESAGPATIESLDQLSRLVKDLDALRAQVPMDPLRFLPHAAAAAGVLLAAGGFLAWKHIQGSTTHDYRLQVSPWGKIVSIQPESGPAIPPPPGESPFHDLKLVPGKYTVTVENPSISGTGSIVVEIPAQHEGAVKLTAPDVKQGVRQLVSRDPFFAQAP